MLSTVFMPAFFVGNTSLSSLSTIITILSGAYSAFSTAYRKNSVYNIALSKFLADQIGLIPVGQIISDNTPVKYREDVAALYNELSEGVYGNVDFIEDGYLIEKKISEYDFGSSTPLILGSSWEQDVAKEKNAVLVEVGTIATEEVVLNRTYIGYTGALQFIEKIYSAAVSG